VTVVVGVVVSVVEADDVADPDTLVLTVLVNDALSVLPMVWVADEVMVVETVIDLVEVSVKLAEDEAVVEAVVAWVAVAVDVSVDVLELVTVDV
jgi:hypothetical protein